MCFGWVPSDIVIYSAYSTFYKHEDNNINKSYKTNQMYL